MTIQAAQSQTLSVLFIDSGVADHQTLIDGAKPGTEVHTLDAEKDGLTQIVRILGGRSGIDAIHIISHGSSGELLIGNTPLTNKNLVDYADELAVVGSALSSDGDVLLYGCNVAAGSAGKAFISALAQAIGANVAASNNPTGATALGGDWSLEIQVGQIKSDIALTDSTINNYAHSLTVETFNSDPGLGGSPSTFTLNGFTYTMSGGDGGGFKYNTFGVGSTGEIAPVSTAFTGATETVTIARSDASAYTFNDVAVFFGPGGVTYTFTGKLGGSTVGTTTSATPTNPGTFQTISFGSSTVIDQLIITATDFNDATEGIDDFNYTLITPTITSATYDASTNSLVVTGVDMMATTGATNDIDVTKLTLTGQGGATYTLTSPNVELDSATQFTVALNATDQVNVEGLLNKVGASSVDATTFNLAAAADWNPKQAGNADATGNAITVSNVQTPTITSATYDASTGSLVVTGTNLVKASGATNDITANKFTFTGEGGSTYTLTDSFNVEITSGTAFTITLSATDKAAINQIVNKNGATSTVGTTYNLAAADDWNTVIGNADISDAIGNGITVSNVAAPTITSATYNASTGALVVTGAGFLKASGAANDIIANKFTFTGEGGATYVLTDSSNVEIASGTAFTITLSATDKAAINQIVNKNGTASTSATTYNLAAAEDWAEGADAAVNVVDATGNDITVSNVAAPTITSAAYNASTGALIVTGAGFLKANGAANDIIANKFTFTGEGGATYALTDSSNVEITSGTAFTITLSATDKAGINQILNKNGTASTSATTYNLAAAEDWAAGADVAVNVVDATGNGITVSNVAAPTITSATYDYNSNVLTVTGTGFLKKSGATNDIDLSMLTLTGEGGATYTLAAASDVEITSGTSFSATLSGADLTGVEALLNKNGTTADSGATYNLAGAEDWAVGADAAVNVVDTTGNGITVSNYAAPTVTSATYDVSTGQLVITGTNLVGKSGATNDLDASLLTITGDWGSYTLTDTSDVDISSATSATLTLSATDQLNVNGLHNKSGTTSGGAVTYNLAAADNWLPGVPSTTDIADLTGNGITVSNVATPTIVSASYDANTHVLSITGTNLFKKPSTNNDIDVSLLTMVGTTSYTLATTSDVEITSATSFTINVTGSDMTQLYSVFDQLGTTSSNATTYNIQAADGWLTAADPAVDISDNNAESGVTVIIPPKITSATYNAGTGVLVVNGTNIQANGGGSDIDASTLTFTGEGGATYTLTDSADVERDSVTQFTVTLSATDKAAVNQIINKDGTTSTSATTYNLAAADDWNTNVTAGDTSDTTSNAITASGVAAPTITSSTYNTATGVLAVTGTGFLKKSGAANDIDASLFTFTGEGGDTYALTDSADVEITSGTAFTLTLSATDKAALNQIINKNGTTSTDATTYNLAAAEDWAAGADAAVNVVDATGNGITASSVAAPTITSSTYHTGTGVLVVTGTGMLKSSGAANDIDASLFTFTGEGGGTYTLIGTSDVEITSCTEFTITLDSTDKAAVNLLLEKAGTTSTDATTYNLAAAEDWAAGADAAVNVVDATGNGITVTIPAPASGGGGGTTTTTTTETVDGTSTSTTTETDGSTTTTVTVVEDTREDDPTTPFSDHADIPIVTNVNGDPILTVSIPTGVGLSVNGQPTALNTQEAITDLINRIEQETSANSDPRTEMTAVGQGFFASLTADESVVVQTITPTVSNNQAPNAPIIITGSDSQNESKLALIIDASNLPSGTIIQLDNVAFAAIIGAVRVVGGKGQNTVIGDHQNQFIVLGADDDVLFGGGGDDTIGSLGGDDQTYGDAGDDIVYGGTANDIMSGGTGNDHLNGGLGFDTAIQPGQQSDYQVTVNGNDIILTHSNGEIDTLTDVELIQFASGSSLAIAYSDVEAAAHHLAKTWLGRDLTVVEGSAVQDWQGDVSDIIQVFRELPEAADHQDKIADELLAGLDDNPNIIQLTVDRELVGGAGDDQGYLSLGLALNVDGGTGHDVLKMLGGNNDVHLETVNGRLELTRLEDGAMLSLINAEAISFDSGESVFIAHSNAEGILGRLFQSFYDRDATAAEWQSNLKLLADGVSADTILDGLQSQASLSDLSDTDYVQTLYSQTYGRQATTAELDHHLLQLNDGQLNREWLAVEIAGSDEAIAVIGNVIVEDGWV